MKEQKILKRAIWFIISVIVLASVSVLMGYMVYKTESYPLGNDIYGHLYKIDMLYNSIKEGVYYPVYSSHWYNGIELFRYWPPLSYYYYCIFMNITQGNIYDAYILFTISVYFIGGLGWIKIGLREERPILGLVLAIIFFTLPDNMRVFFAEGNIPRIFITMLLPYYFYEIYSYLYHHSKRAFLRLTILTILIVFAHIMISAMVGVSAFILILYYTLINKDFKHGVRLLVNLILSYIPSAIVLVPGLIGGIVTQNSSASVKTSSDWSLEAIYSLNPMIRIRNLDMFYFGISLMVVIMVGLLCMRKRTAPSFLSALTIFFGTTMVALPILSALPMSQVFWAIRFVPMAEVIILIGVVYWEELKKVSIVVIVGLIVVDSTLSLRFLNIVDKKIEAREVYIEQSNGLDVANEIVENRIAVMDISSIGSYTSYMLIKNDRDIKSAFGWSYQGAYTIKEIVSLNEAFEKQYYNYMFSRLLEYGCDTVVIKKTTPTLELDRRSLNIESEKYKYKQVTETDDSIVYKRDVGGTYGTIYKYRNACIGKGAEYISFLYPSFHKLRNENLDEYTYDELKDYEKIYISGPYYKNRVYCEELVSKLARDGVKIYVDMTNLTEDKSRGRNTFLGVVAQPITFTKDFPVIEKEDGSQFRLGFMSENYSKWSTAYFTNLQTVTRKSEYQDGKYLDYLGLGSNPNITFIGLNLVYYCFDNKTEDLYEFLDEVFLEDREEEIGYEVVPIEVAYRGEEIIIKSEEDGVNANLANLDSFASNRDLGKETFININKGETVIKVTYVYLRESILISIIGIAILIVYQMIERSKQYEEEDIEENRNNINNDNGV